MMTSQGRIYSLSALNASFSKALQSNTFTKQLAASQHFHTIHASHTRSSCDNANADTLILSSLHFHANSFHIMGKFSIGTALLHKSKAQRGGPHPRRSDAMAAKGTVVGRPSCVKRLSRATRTCNSTT
jgi:hypothetical protein